MHVYEGVDIEEGRPLSVCHSNLLGRVSYNFAVTYTPIPFHSLWNKICFYQSDLLCHAYIHRFLTLLLHRLHINWGWTFFSPRNGIQRHLFSVLTYVHVCKSNSVLFCLFCWIYGPRRLSEVTCVFNGYMWTPMPILCGLTSLFYFIFYFYFITSWKPWLLHIRTFYDYNRWFQVVETTWKRRFP